jgi:hypothetical protein
MGFFAYSELHNNAHFDTVRFVKSNTKTEKFTLFFPAKRISNNQGVKKIHGLSKFFRFQSGYPELSPTNAKNKRAESKFAPVLVRIDAELRATEFGLGSLLS